jgi:hypothetical protein
MGFTKQHNNLGKRVVHIQTYTFTFPRSSRYWTCMRKEIGVVGGGRNRSPDCGNSTTLDLHPPSLPDKPLAAPILGQISAAIAM